MILVLDVIIGIIVSGFMYALKDTLFGTLDHLVSKHYKIIKPLYKENKGGKK